MIAKTKPNRPKTVVVIGNGMVGHRFVQRLTEFDERQNYQVVAFCEEPRPAYNRVNLTKFFEYRDSAPLMMTSSEWYNEKGVSLFVGDMATEIDRGQRIVRSREGREIHYDRIVLATGSSAFVPPIAGVEKKGVFVYRTIEDLKAILAYAKHCRSAAVIGGGLLGLEAGKASLDLGLETHIVEAAPRLMPRQLDDAGSRLLVNKIEDLGVKVHIGNPPKEITGMESVDGLAFADGQKLDVGMVIVAAGIRPRDELARACGLLVGDRGGVIVDDLLRTSDPHIFAIGEVALHRKTIHGLVAPGYEMADIVANHLTGTTRYFCQTHTATKLKLMGVDVASFGNCTAAADSGKSIVYEDPFQGIYQKLLVSHDGTKILEGIFVGDTSNYDRLLALFRGDKPLAVKPGSLLFGEREADSESIDEMADEMQVCSCNNVSKGAICHAIHAKKLFDIFSLKTATNAATCCGGCLPVVQKILHQELEKAGQKVDKRLCEHFAYTRQELFEIVKIKQIRSFGELIADHGKGNGCETCRPAVASILASLWNDNILDHSELQDTNDRFLANIQKGGSYSVIPRIPGGEITPEKLITIGEIAKKYGLYTKLTGGQRIDMLGAPVHRLPDIWEELVDAGFESGHAYGKALRTIKSCVGTTWCRFAVGDSVGFAVRLELRYRGIRAPHKLKAAVSGCVRECAEAQSKDFGLIATEKGWNLFVCGNGGAQPRHADLLASDLDEDTCIRYIDRFLMYYIQTADRLTRTSKWLEAMDGGIDYLRDVIVNDRLKIGEELERQAQYLVESYKCEWRETVKDPVRRQVFRQFVNSDDTEPGVEFVVERGQKRPAGWPSDLVQIQSSIDTRCSELNGLHRTDGAKTDLAQWYRVGRVNDFPKDSGACVKVAGQQIAIYRFSSRNEWHACQNMCPHKRELVLSRGLLGDANGVPKVACPVHKKAFSLQSGKCLSGEDLSVEVYSIKVEGDEVFVQVLAANANESLSAAKMACGCGGLDLNRVGAEQEAMPCLSP
jgi:nitrite reductase (NADH) large subunit